MVHENPDATDTKMQYWAAAKFFCGGRATVNERERENSTEAKDGAHHTSGKSITKSRDKTQNSSAFSSGKRDTVWRWRRSFLRRRNRRRRRRRHGYQSGVGLKKKKKKKKKKKSNFCKRFFMDQQFMSDLES
jgi:hypothetical protein